MSLTTSQLEAIAKFSYGSDTFHVLKSSGSTTIFTESETDIYYVHKWRIESHIEAASHSQLKTRLDNLTTAITSGKDFKLYRESDVIAEILATDCIHGGPVANVEFTGPIDYGTCQSFTFTIEGHIPVTVSSGLISHTFASSIKIDDDDVITAKIFNGIVITKSPTSAKDWIINNIPDPAAGDIRNLNINTDDSDTKATYNYTDTESPYRNQVPTVVKDHKYTDTTITQEEVLISTRRSGSVITIDPNDAVTWINANLPALSPGFNRQVDISVDDTGWTATYSVNDTLSTYRNQVPATIKDHQYTIRTLTENDVVQTIAQSGTVTAEPGQDAYTWFLANLPATNEGFRRTQDIRVTDNSEIVTYTITDSAASGNIQFPPGINDARLETRTSLDDQQRRVINKFGSFAGNEAQANIDAIRNKLGVENILSEEIKTSEYNDGTITFSFTVLESKYADQIFLSWFESVRVSGGGYATNVVTHADRDPFIFKSALMPVIVVFSGRAEAKQNYPKPPPLVEHIKEYIDGTPDYNYARNNEHVAVTTWTQRYILPAIPNDDYGYVVPRAPIIEYVI